jgi:hypothetical protein
MQEYLSTLKISRIYISISGENAPVKAINSSLLQRSMELSLSLSLRSAESRWVYLKPPFFLSSPFLSPLKNLDVYGWPFLRVGEWVLWEWVYCCCSSRFWATNRCRKTLSHVHSVGPKELGQKGGLLLLRYYGWPAAISSSFIYWASGSLISPEWL